MLEDHDFAAAAVDEDLRDRSPLAVHWLQAAAAATTSDPEARRIWAFRIPDRDRGHDRGGGLRLGRGGLVRPVGGLPRRGDTEREPPARRRRRGRRGGALLLRRGDPGGLGPGAPAPRTRRRLPPRGGRPGSCSGSAWPWPPPPAVWSARRRGPDGGGAMAGGAAGAVAARPRLGLGPDPAGGPGGPVLGGRRGRRRTTGAARLAVRRFRRAHARAAAADGAAAAVAVRPAAAGRPGQAGPGAARPAGAHRRLLAAARLADDGVRPRPSPERGLVRLRRPGVAGCGGRRATAWAASPPRSARRCRPWRRRRWPRPCSTSPGGSAVRAPWPSPPSPRAWSPPPASAARPCCSRSGRPWRWAWRRSSALAAHGAALAGLAPRLGGLWVSSRIAAAVAASVSTLAPA